MITIEVATAMTEPVRTATADATMVEAARELRGAAIGALVVLDGDDIVGTVTESDIVTVVTSGTGLDDATVSDCMAGPVHTVRSDEAVTDAGGRMRDHSGRRMPVVDDGELAGIVTTADLAYYLPRLRAMIKRERLVGPD
jgi:CBS domain-containing protein